jgi:hypothetical protein
LNGYEQQNATDMAVAYFKILFLYFSWEGGFKRKLQIVLRRAAQDTPSKKPLYHKPGFCQNSKYFY